MRVARTDVQVLSAGIQDALGRRACCDLGCRLCCSCCIAADCRLPNACRLAGLLVQELVGRVGGEAAHLGLAEVVILGEVPK